MFQSSYDCKNLTFIYICRGSVKENKGQKILCNSTLENTQISTKHHSPSNIFGENVPSQPNNSKPFDVLVTCLPTKATENTEIAHTLLKHNANSEEDGNMCFECLQLFHIG